MSALAAHALCVLALTACGGSDGGSSTADSSAELALVRSDPAANGNAADPDAAPTLVFSQAININAAATDSKLSLTGPGGQVEGTVKIAGSQVSFTPNQSLTLGAAYTLSAQGLTSIDGRAMRAPIEVPFKVRSGSWGRAAVVDRATVPVETPSIATDARGNAISVWVQYNAQGSASPTAVMASRFDAKTGNWSEPLALSSLTSARAPQIAMDPQGNAIAMWTQRNDDEPFRVWARRYDAKSGQWSAIPAQIEDGVGAEFSLAIGRNGHAAALIAGSSSALVSSYDATVDRWTRAAKLPFQGEVDSIVERPVIGVDAKGNALAAWMQNPNLLNPPVPGANFGQLGAARYDAGTQRWELLAGPERGGRLYQLESLRLAVSDRGDAVLAWTTSTTATNVGELRSSRYLPAGTQWAPYEVLANNPLQGLNILPFRVDDVAIDAKGNAHVAFTQSDRIGDDSNFSYVYMLKTRRLDVRTSAWSAAVTLDRVNGQILAARLDTDACGNVSAAWNRSARPLSEPANTPYESSVAARRYDHATGQWEAPTALPQPRGGNALEPVIALAVSQSGRAWAAWTWTKYDSAANRFYTDILAVPYR